MNKGFNFRQIILKIKYFPNFHSCSSANDCSRLHLKIERRPHEHRARRGDFDV